MKPELRSIEYFSSCDTHFYWWRCNCGHAEATLYNQDFRCKCGKLYIGLDYDGNIRNSGIKNT